MQHFMKTVLTTTFLFITQFFYCQILGKVVDDNGKTLSQVLVTVKDSLIETGIDGSFKISPNLTSGKFDLSFQHPRRGAKILIKEFSIKNVQKIEFEMPRLLEYFGEVVDKTQFVFIHCLCYTNQSYPYYRDKLDKNFIAITINDNKYKITNYTFDESKNMFIINWNEI